GMGHLDLAARRADGRRSLGRGVAEENAVGFVLKVLQGQAVGLLPEAVAEGAGANAKVQNTLRPTLRVALEGHRRVDAGLVAHAREEPVVEGVDVGIRVAAENGAEAGDDLPLLRSVVGDEGGGGVVAAAGEAPGPGP